MSKNEEVEEEIDEEEEEEDDNEEEEEVEETDEKIEKIEELDEEQKAHEDSNEKYKNNENKKIIEEKINDIKINHHSFEQNNKSSKEIIIKDYYGQKGIVRRTIGTGKVNVKVYEDEDDDAEGVVNEELNIISNINNNESKDNNFISYEIEQDSKIFNNINNIIDSSDFTFNSYNKTPKETKSKNEEKNQTTEKAENKDRESNNNPIKEKFNYSDNENGNNSISFNIDGKKFIIKAEWNFSYNKKNEKIIIINLSTIYPGSQIMHWAIYKSNSPKKWSLPPKTYYPKLTKKINNILETEFILNEKGERIISLELPTKLNNKEYIKGIYFVIYDPIKNIWYNNFRNNFIIKFNY